MAAWSCGLRAGLSFGFTEGSRFKPCPLPSSLTSGRFGLGSKLSSTLKEHPKNTLATGVVQLYLADQPDSTRWNKRCCGVACFVKDSSKKSFYIRVYDIKKQQLIWEQELYNNIVYKAPREYFHTFEADSCQAGLNFASEDEAVKFKKAIDNKLMDRQRRKNEKGRRRQNTIQQKPPNDISRPPNIAQQRSNAPAIPTPQPVTINVDLNRSNNNLSSAGTGTIKKGKENKKDAKKKLTKADIGTPSNFVHVSHVGWDPDKGFDMNNLEPDMQKLFQSVGIKADDNIDKETVDFIYDFVEKHGGIQAVKQALGPGRSGLPPPPPSGGAPPPPPPSRTPAPAPPPPSRGGAPPPPPPSRVAPAPTRGAAPLPPPAPNRGMPAPPRAPVSAPPLPPPNAPPPLPSNIGGGPPPPPPPPQMGGPPPPPPPPPPPTGGDTSGRNDLLSAIRSGTQLKPAAVNDGPKPTDSRDDLLNAIRQGAALKKVEASDRTASSPSGETDGLVGALARALANRQKQIHGSDDEDDSDDDDEDVSDDDDWDD
ncbi:actin nucleation-promoting factor WASL-like isoform X2 [Biomphalaria glabrata]|uniref:Actin nucleation-promoting factor WASL-like isoform X2 n=1 Tax=Biomphalaria glabrata TaxID=6526 RepID=A0A9W3A6E4_BIOGL|nr:actin nucleation-promoting factor WASL-like isoform X2 [Biomphalaria glabrata]